MTDELEVALLEAHSKDDKDQLIGLYTIAADRAEASGQLDGACFFLTHAWVYALEAGDPRAAHLKARLVAYGREVET